MSQCGSFELSVSEMFLSDCIIVYLICLTLTDAFVVKTEFPRSLAAGADAPEVGRVGAASGSIF